MADINSVEEFKHFAYLHSLPLADMRFAVGENKGYEPRWFYLYFDPITEEWVVAKNKDTGERVERYRGPSEEEACHILFDKLTSEVSRRGLLHNEYKDPWLGVNGDEWTVVKRNDSPSSNEDYVEIKNKTPHKKREISMLPILIIMVVIVLTYVGMGGNVGHSSYYDNDDYYYYDYGDYDDYDDYDSYDSYDSFDSYDSYDSYDTDWGSDW